MLGILAPMQQELDAVRAGFDADRAERVMGRTFHRGVEGGHDAVAVISGIGKTAVATTTTLLIERFGVNEVLLIGVAGAVAAGLAQGDVVVASELVHHDLDARPIFPRYEVPGHGTGRLRADAALGERALAAASQLAAAEGTRALRGPIASGDQFLGPQALAELRARLPDVLAVEMEGAAVAQVCIEAGVPCAVVRTISDDGDPGEFARFLERDAGRYAHELVGRLLASG
ncbi:MAG TPA: 5'-methylthioadenosine/adenosylhomocysteine nucleosidase [Solirubrobacteraceae bacterium]|nr:5'-methylthioadenosine/adenosylhomocysteine nucleosidase [Solirubrobacteraceae bacterium]